eukprot:SAG31_NODE_4314_length_3365_cov_2.309247_1_plen_100_part_00
MHQCSQLPSTPHNSWLTSIFTRSANAAPHRGFTFVGQAVGSVLGSVLAETAGITLFDYSGLAALCWWRVALSALVVAFVGLVPRETAIAHAVERMKKEL